MTYDEERHRNALDLNLRHIEFNKYKLPVSWTGNDVIVDLSATGKEQFQILMGVAKQLAEMNKQKASTIAKLEEKLEGLEAFLLELD